MATRIALYRQTLGDFALRVAGDFKDTLTAVQPPQQQLRETPQHVRAKDNIDARIALFNFFRNVLLLHHTAAHADGHIRAGFLDVRILPHDAEHALFRMLAHGAGIDYNDIRFGSVLCAHIAHLRQHACDALSIRFVLLAAEGLAVKMRRLRAQRIAPVYLFDAIQLMRDVRLRYLS